MGKTLAGVEATPSKMGAEEAVALHGEVAAEAAASYRVSVSHAPSEDVHLVKGATARSTKVTPKNSHRLAVQVVRGD